MRLLVNACFVADEEDAVNEAVLISVLSVSDKIVALYWQQARDGSLFLKDNFRESVRLSHYRWQLVSDIFVRKFPNFCIEYLDFAVQIHKNQISALFSLRKDRDLRSVTADNIHALLSSSANTLTIHCASFGIGKRLEYST